MTTDSAAEVTADLITELLRDQHPDLAGLPVTFGARGWSNQLWRLGDDLAVRLPYAAGNAGETLLKEHARLPALAPRLPATSATCAPATRPATWRPAGSCSRTARSTASTRPTSPAPTRRQGAVPAAARSPGRFPCW